MEKISSSSYSTSVVFLIPHCPLLFPLGARKRRRLLTLFCDQPAFNNDYFLVTAANIATVHNAIPTAPMGGKSTHCGSLIESAEGVESLANG